MSILSTWILRQLVKGVVKQGKYHELAITTFYGVLVKAAREEFYEDNRPTLNAFLEACHKRALATW